MNEAPYLTRKALRASIAATKPVDHGSEWLRRMRGFPHPTLRKSDQHLFAANRLD